MVQELAQFCKDYRSKKEQTQKTKTFVNLFKTLLLKILLKPSNKFLPENKHLILQVKTPAFFKVIILNFTNFIKQNNLLLKQTSLTECKACESS